MKGRGGSRIKGVRAKAIDTAAPPAAASLPAPCAISVPDFAVYPRTGDAEDGGRAMCHASTGHGVGRAQGTPSEDPVEPGPPSIRKLSTGYPVTAYPSSIPHTA
eukprot:3941378-Rhodomonas_salina.2